MERIQVTAPTQASPEEQIKASQALVEQLKAERVLADGNPLSESTNKKRSREIVEKDEEAENLPVVTRPTKRSWFGRTRRAATPASASVENERSGAARLLGFAALTAAGAAA